MIQAKGQLTPFGMAVAGAFGAMAANFLVHPLDVVKTRLQVQKEGDDNNQEQRVR